MFRLFERERTPLFVVLYAVFMYFQGLSLRAVSGCLEDLCPRSYVAVRDWVQRLSHLNQLFTIGRVRCFLVDETYIRVGSQEAWLWLAFEPYGRRLLGFYLSRTRNILTAELFLRGLMKRYGRHPVWTDGADWYPAACRYLRLEHHLYDYLRWNLMERLVQYVKDRTEAFDDYFPCRREHCRLEHVRGWLGYYQLAFNLFKRHEALEISPIKQLTQLIKGSKDPP